MLLQWQCFQVLYSYEDLLPNPAGGLVIQVEVRFLTLLLGVLVVRLRHAPKNKNLKNLFDLLVCVCPHPPRALFSLLFVFSNSAGDVARGVLPDGLEGGDRQYQRMERDLTTDRFIGRFDIFTASFISQIDCVPRRSELWHIFEIYCAATQTKHAKRKGDQRQRRPILTACFDWTLALADH